MAALELLRAVDIVDCVDRIQRCIVAMAGTADLESEIRNMCLEWEVLLLCTVAAGMSHRVGRGNLVGSAADIAGFVMAAAIDDGMAIGQTLGWVDH